jgi:COP9 signalosome complex subunit 7
VLSALDNRIVSIQQSAAAAQRKLADHEQARDKIMNELAANKGGRAAQDRRKALQDNEAMDVDGPVYGGAEPSSPEKGRRK